MEGRAVLGRFVLGSSLGVAMPDEAEDAAVLIEAETVGGVSATAGVLTTRATAGGQGDGGGSGVVMEDNARTRKK